MFDYDLFVIGAGSGGVRASRFAAGFGAKVAVIRNLISNSIKFSSDKDLIEISAKKTNGMFEICVKDQGTGIPTEDQEKIFKVDAKYKSKGTAGEQGTGLGLVLCKEFVEKNGGSIWFVSEPGIGTNFYFTIPADEK